ncbi:hypothetical protein MZD04_gp277 [Pseudomonas phage Psa21]|uniref:Uncharacterized protein n=1 Tax=Pseudomonas phage Psa21 TaxID=2530023 RepID=A0A481W5Z0_9CAUD|nr:hypothetical protein MZD04_gp277 [Pseudomonas phage Psa21]QBJ02803.1 hypothetical protein PSA21_277 [Pseudomonas phage Psa21]
MSKSYRTCYYSRKELWSPRPMRFWTANKWSKVKCHRIERVQAKHQIFNELHALCC